MENNRLNSDSHGFAVPLALICLIVFGALTGGLVTTSMNHFKLIKQEEATHDTFFVAEGAMHDQARWFGLEPEKWREQIPLGGTQPSGYTSFAPESFTSTNGIPTCTGLACLRSYVPTGGGLLKNIGPITSHGVTIDGSYTVDQQLNYTTPQTADVTLNTISGWTQVERLDKVFTPGDSVGASLDSGSTGGSTAYVVRIRVTSYATRTVKGELGETTLVSVFEIPSV